MFNKELKKFMQRWQLLTAFAEFVVTVSRTTAGPVHQMDVIYLVSSHLEHEDDEVPMDIINYVMNSLSLDGILPEATDLEQNYISKEK